MLAFTNNSSPLFIIGTVGILLLGNYIIGILLFITHILASITVGIILGLESRLLNPSNSLIKDQRRNTTHKFNALEKCTISNLGSIIATSISKAINSTLQIGGFIVLFSIIISIIKNLNIVTYISNFLNIFGISKNFSSSLILGLIELTNGVNLAANLHVKNISINIILCSFLLGFGGFSILLQVLGIISKVRLSIKKYLYGRFLQGLIAALYTSIFINKFALFKLDISNCSQKINTSFYSFVLLFVLIFFILLIFFIQKKTFTHNKRLN